MEFPPRDLGESIVCGSDELFDLFCQPCSTEGQHLEAVAYCEYCMEYLCNICYKCHRKMVATRSHNVLYMSEMTKVTRPSESETKDSDEMRETCPRHVGKMLVSYCRDHTDMCCNECLQRDHRRCRNLMDIKEIPGHVGESKDYREVKDNLQGIVVELGTRIQRMKTEREMNKENTQTVLTHISDFRTEVTKLQDQLESDVVRKVTELSGENVKLIDKQEDSCQSMLFDITQTLSQIEEFAKQGQNNNLYAAVQRELQRPPGLEDLSASKGKQITRFSFPYDDNVKKMLSALPGIWSLSISVDNSVTKARCIGDIGVKAPDDGLNCSITGLATLGGSRLVSVDYPNKSLKLIDINLDKVISSVCLSSEPFDVTTVGNDQVAVALANERVIGIFNVSDKLLKHEVINLPDSVVVSLSYDGNHFIAACQHPGSVKIIDKTGRVLSTYGTASSGEQLFTMPRYIAMNTVSDLIVVADHTAHTVTCLKMDGTVVSVYKHERLKRPRGLAVGEDGSVYVCVYDTNTVHQLSPTGVFQRIILGVEHGMSTYPPAIAYQNGECRLFVSSNSKRPDLKNFLKVFKLE